MPAERRRVSDDYQLHTGPRDGDIHTSEVAEKSDLSLVVGPHETDEDNIALLSLEAVDRVDCYQTPIGLEELAFSYQPLQILHLRGRER